MDNRFNFNTDPIILTEVTTEMTEYRERHDRTVNIPLNVKWVAYDGIIKSKYDGHVNYWTVIPATFHNLKESKRFADSCYCYRLIVMGRIFLYMRACKPIDGIETVSHETMAEQFKLKGMVVACVSKEYGHVSEVYKIQEILHPQVATIHSYRFHTSFGGDLCCGSIENDIDLTTQDRKIHHIVLERVNGLKLWRDVQYRFSFRMNRGKYPGDGIDWEIPDYYDRISNIDIVNDFHGLMSLHEEWQKFINQFY